LGLRINIVTSGRFHVLDLARELAALGHDVRFYSCVPRARAVRFGLPAHCHRGRLLWLAPLLALASRGPVMIRVLAESLLKRLLDRAATISMEACDVFIGMSGLCVASARAARDRGAKVFLERGSRHIVSQKAILESIPGARRPAVSTGDVERELAGYGIADVIVVPSRHAEESFRDAGVPPTKLFRNPYGVDLDMFAATAKPSNKHPTVITVGSWSLQKGCDLLWQACRARGSWRLVHVGSLADAPIPASDRFEHQDPVSQWKLAEQFAAADVMVLASRQDGFGLVLAQALACGLPVVCTDRTGGVDLREMLDDPRWAVVVPHDDAEALRRGIEEALALAKTQAGRRELPGGARERLSWTAYARRYDAELARRCSR
jgi:alpha-maltose-1-phosphate synthase